MDIFKSLKVFTDSLSLKSTDINGTPVEIFENPHAPTLSMAFSFHDGVTYEPSSLWGLSHFVEHILFRGSEKFPSLYNLSRKVEGIGGQVSAFSTRDMTSFWIKVLPGYEDDALTVMEDLITNPLLKKENIEAERAIIHQERQREINNPAFFTSLLIECLLLLPFPRARHPVGKDEVIEKIDYSLLKDYIKKYYHKNNMGITVAGNKGKDFEKKLEETLKKFPSGEKAKTADFKISSELTEGKLFHQPSHHKNQVYLSIGWKFPVKSRPEIFNWRIINTTLGAGYTSILNRILREKENITYLCSTRFNVFQDRGIFKINLALADKNLNRAIELITGIIDDLKKGNIPEDIYREAVVRHGAHVVTRMEDSLNMAKMMAQFLIREDRPFSFKEYLDQLENVSLSIASDLAKKHLTDENRKILIHTGSEIVERDFPGILKLDKGKLGEIIF